MYLIYHAINKEMKMKLKTLPFEFTPSQWWYENEPLQDVSEMISFILFIILYFNQFNFNTQYITLFIHSLYIFNAYMWYTYEYIFVVKGDRKTAWLQLRGKGTNNINYYAIVLFLKILNIFFKGASFLYRVS